MPPNTPVRFIRQVGSLISNAWNRVQLEDANGDLLNSTNPLPITVSASGILSYSNEIIVTPTLTVAGAYHANDYVGTSGVSMEFTNAARFNGGTGYIQSVAAIDADLQSISLELWLFKESVTPPADNAAWSISDADMLKWIATFQLQTYFASALNSGSSYDGYPKGFKCAAGSRSIWGCFVTRGTPTYVTQHLSAKIVILQD